MKRIVVLLLLIVLLFGCSTTQDGNDTKTTVAVPHQNLKANATYLDAEILETWEEDDQFFITFSAWLHDGMIEAEVTASESLYNSLTEFQDSHRDEELKFDLSIDGDDAYMLGIAPATKREFQP
ncbi:hypothetical protein [Planomicrobium sp. Y74]|uniref:hypothetical protein n=1 Tax=Planomicrobium sp. Y74 TaxID=2478977 RepID=UPI000EF4D789|nr:hypothetical protein [Planomicrobium sp. Y74]RLQ92790.1 hypothetical protein D9754_01875 [Planomicrobium sp. Y74]